MRIPGLARRARRYLNTYAWLTRQHLRFHPVLFLAQQGLAVGARIGTIIGLIVCAHFLAHLIVAVERPTTHALGFGLQLSNGEYKTVMILLPVAILLVAALFQYWSTVLFGRLLCPMAIALADDYAGRIAKPEACNPLGTGRGYALLLQLLLRIEFRFLTLLQNALILFGVAIGSVIVVGPLIASGIFLFLLTFIGVFLLFRQRQAHDLQASMLALDRERLDILKELDQKAPERKEGAPGEAHDGLTRKLASVLHARFYLGWSFRELSRTAGLIVQAGLVAAILVYAATMQVADPTQFARLVSLFVIMRFGFATGQTINAIALAIAPDYPSLVRIVEGRDYPDSLAPSPGVGVDNTEDEDRLA